MDLQLHASNSNSSLQPMQALCFGANVDTMSDGGLLSIESHRSVPAPFLTKTYQLVDDPATDHIVSWGEDESTFVVWRPPEFARDLLPNYFKHNNFSSFVRQLNTYGFRKIVPDRWEFANDFFRKGEKHLLCEIHRRKTAQNSRSSPTNSTEDLILQQQTSMPPWSPLSSPITSPHGAAFAAAAAAHVHVGMQQAAAAAMAHGNMTHISNMSQGAAARLSLSDENERLRRDNTLLLTELTRMKKLYHDILLYVQHQNLHAQGQASRVGGRPSHGQASDLSSQSSSFHMPSSQRSLVYHSASMSGMKSNIESPTSRLACGADNGRAMVSTAMPFPVPISTHILQLPAMAGRHDASMQQNSYCNMDVRNFRSAIMANCGAAPATSTLSVSTTSSDKALEGAGAKGSAESGEKSLPKLFGVTLQSASKKRPHGDNEAVHNDDDALLSKSSVTTNLTLSKSAKTSELALELKQPNMTSSSSMAHAPWLKFNASRDEQVYN
ncbi:hypothetical protein L7F22_060117 [Adiantum nelumboides]|nr:hypothetical protein [Adiantum nelumboides]